MVVNLDSLGNRIKCLREKNSISQKEFAQKIGISNAVLSRYESDNRKPDYDTLQLIADSLDVSTDYLLGRTDLLEPLTINDKVASTFINDSELYSWYKELPLSPEDKLRKLKKIWEIINDIEE